VTWHEHLGAEIAREFDGGDLMWARTEDSTLTRCLISQAAERARLATDTGYRARRQATWRESKRGGEAPSRVLRAYRCRTCGAEGHTRRTCAGGST
jgi:hypothetical protein